MNILGFLFSAVASVLLYTLPRHLAALPLLASACFMTQGQELELGPLHFPVIRILVTVGFLRVLSKGERLAGGIQLLDKLMIAWGIWAVASSVFHADGALVFRLGMAF